VGAVAIGAIIGILLGIISALKKYTWVDSLVLVISMFFQSVPEFVVALVLIMIFAVNLHWLPATGITSIKGFILPMLCIGLSSVANYTRITRSSMLEVLGEDYIRTARAKGQTENNITFHHALRNAMIPVA
jgi:peptide/nickel transport system permease protein